MPLEKEDNLGKITDKAIDTIFNLKKETIFAIIIILVGFILRILSAFRTRFSADEMVHGVHAIGFISSGKLQIMDQSAVWFWLSDFFMKILGVDMIGIRSMSIIFGTLALILVYLITSEVFNKKIGLIALIISTFSPYQIDMIEAGMDMSMAFFILFSIYFFILSIKKDSRKYFYLSWVAIGIAAMVKPIAVIFIIALGLSSLYFHLFNKKSKISFKDYIYVFLILVIVLLPVLTFNYLLYKDKGILDLQFSRFTRVSVDQYASIAPTIESFSFSKLLTTEKSLNPGILEGVFFMFKYEFSDPLLTLILALIGLIFSFRSKNRFRYLFVITFAIPFIFLAGTSVLPNHFIFTSFYMMPFAAKGISSISKYLKSKKSRKIFIILAILAILLFSFMNIKSGDAKGLIGNENELGQVVDIKKDQISSKSLVITDSRIYRGRTVFMFWDRNYLEAQAFLEILPQMSSIPGEQINLDLYFLECIPDDCGWGTIKNQPGLNESMESIVSQFKENAQLVETVEDVDGSPYFNLYKTSYQANSGILPIAQSTHEWFFYPVNYQPKSKIFDNYETHSLTDEFLDRLAHIILYIDVLVALLLGATSIYLLLREN